MCGDMNVPREQAFKACSESFNRLCEVLARGERLRRAGEQRCTVLGKELKIVEEKYGQMKAQLEVMEGSTAFYNDGMWFGSVDICCFLDRHITNCHSSNYCQN
ncbi:hypothetical protein ILYODFUR_036583 [Ilyodon furcidens]|uniref:Uncharacterized protein n=1 Tax=Ilyodon furcidens TaxID=33524 RepID=A0ABV0U0R4_9TELE